MKHCLLASLLASLFSLTPAVVQAQDAAKLLNLFQSLLGTGRPVVPAAPAGGVAGALLDAALLAPNATPQSNRGSELLQLLSQSLDQISAPGG